MAISVSFYPTDLVLEKKKTSRNYVFIQIAASIFVYIYFLIKKESFRSSTLISIQRRMDRMKKKEIWKGREIIRSVCLRRKVKIREGKTIREGNACTYTYTYIHIYIYIYIYIYLCLVPRSQQPLSETRQLAVLRSCSAVFRVIYSREMARFLVYILEREPHYFVHPVICPLVVCPDPPSPVGFLRFLGTAGLAGPLRGGV